MVGAPEGLDSASSAAIWTAILDGAASVGFTPLNGTVQDAKVLNAGSFILTAQGLAFSLTLDDATPPPVPGGKSP